MASKEYCTYTPLTEKIGLPINCPLPNVKAKGSCAQSCLKAIGGRKVASDFDKGTYFPDSNSSRGVEKNWRSHI